MSTITVQDVQSNLPAVLARIAAGESLVITDHDKAVAEIKPVERLALRPRPFGLSKGQFEVPDNFNDPLPDEILDAFEGKSESFGLP